MRQIIFKADLNDRRNDDDNDKFIVDVYWHASWQDSCAAQQIEKLEMFWDPQRQLGNVYSAGWLGSSPKHRKNCECCPVPLLIVR